jgi:poly(A) polymerase
LLRVQAGEDLAEVAQWWTKFQELDDDARLKMIKPEGAKKKKRTRSKRRRLQEQNDDT